MYLCTVVLPVRTCGVAEWGTIAASCGMEPISGSGVLLGGELASGDITILGFSYRHRHMKHISYLNPDYTGQKNNRLKGLDFKIFTTYRAKM